MQIALDRGFGNTKICVGGETAVVQSAVARPREIGLAAIGSKTAVRCPEVVIGGETFAVGEGAWRWGEPLGIRGLDYSALASTPSLALFYAALSEIILPGRCDAELIIGLPVPLLERKAEAEAVIGRLREIYKTTHAWTIEGRLYELRVTRLSVAAQPVGAYTDYIIGDDLRPRKGAASAQIAVLDLGMNTLDLFVVQGGRVDPRWVSGSEVGAHRMLEQLDGARDLEELDADVRAGRLKPAKAALDSWLGEVLGEVRSTWPDLRRFSAVVPAGGGSVLLGESLRRALESRGAVVAWPGDPVTANVRGLWKSIAYQGGRK